MKRYQVLKAPQSGYVVWDTKEHSSTVFGTDCMGAIQYAREQNETAKYGI